MKRINLVKFGFVRTPENDFTDDFNRFQTYLVGKNVRVSKLVADGQVYLSIASAVGNGTLPYDIYSKLPHYNDANWKWNGVSAASLTDSDIEDFLIACLAYELEYEKAEAAIKYPTLEEIQEKAVKVTAKRLLELDTIEWWIKNHALEAAAKFTAYEWKQVQEYSKHLMADVKRFDPAVYPQTIVGTSHSFDFVKPEYEMQDSYWFTCLRYLFEKYNLN